MKKRMAAVVLALMVAGALTACSGSKTETKDTQATTQAKETEAKQTEAKQTEAKQTEAKQTEAKQTEAKETEAKETEAKETEAKQTEAKETEAKETEAKTTEAPKTTEASETEAAAGTEAEEQLPDKAEYTIYNQTGEAVTSIQFYQNDIKKMIVSDGTPLADGESRVVTIEKDDTVTPDTTYSFSFQTEGGYVAFYRTLHFEIVPMTLIAEDAKTGATPFQFAEPEVSATEAATEAEAAEAATEAETEAEKEERPLPDTAKYVFTNKTGEDVTELTVTNNDTKEVVLEIKKALKDGKDVKLSIDKDDKITGKTSYTVSFKTKSGYEAEFKTLHFEVAKVNLIAEDAKSGATPIEFEKDDETEAETEAETETEA